MRLQFRSDESVIAVNWWYDQQFDIRYAYFGFVEKLLHQTHREAAAASGADVGPDHGRSDGGRRKLVV